MTISLTKFCKDYNLAKSTVYQRCQELNLDVKHGLDEKPVKILKSEFELLQVYSLESLRGDEAVSFEDPLAIAP